MNIIDKILTNLINILIEGSGELINGMLENLLQKVFFAERYFTQSLSGISELMNLDAVYQLFLDFAISLIILKFLKKGFDIYIGWQDGDKDSDPTALVMNFIRAIVTAISFRYFYGILVEIVSDFSDKALSSLLSLETSSNIVTAILNVSNNVLFWVIAGLILIICYCILWIKFLVLGVEMLMLRIAFPLACIGLIDSDKGMFTPYMKKIFTICITGVIQIFLLRMSMVLAGAGHIAWGIALASGALKTPKSLQEFMFAYGSGGNPISNMAGSVYHIKQLIRKIPKPVP